MSKTTKNNQDIIAQYEKELQESEGMQWYIVTAVTTKEDTVAKDIYDKLVGYNFKDRVGKIEILKEERVTKEIFTPETLPNTYGRKQKGITWNTIDLGNGKFKYEKTKVKLVNKYPGYIFVNCIMTDEVWYVIRNTANVTGVVGSSGRGVKPIPISNEEFERMKSNIKNSDVEFDVKINKEEEISNVPPKTVAKPIIEVDYSVGDVVEIIGSGEATVEHIDLDKQKVTVSIDMFGSIQKLVYDLDAVKSKKQNQ